MRLKDNLDMGKYIEIIDGEGNNGEKTLCSYFSVLVEIPENGNTPKKRGREPICLYHTRFSHLEKEYGSCKHFELGCMRSFNHGNYVNRL